MRNILSQLLAVGPELVAFILAAPLLGVNANFTQQAVGSPNLDLSKLGRVAIGGDFDSISLYTYVGQNENTSTNGSQSLLTRYPDGAFQSLALADAHASIVAMCSFISRDGTFNGVIVGGNFTSLGGKAAAAVALWNPSDDSITPLDGLSGSVKSVYCDQDASTVYVGGSFSAGNSTNAMAWATGWVNLPFSGFNGPVNSITKNSAGNIVFGGQFGGLGSNAMTPVSNMTARGQQTINLSGGSITAAGTSGTAGFTEPSNIVCKTGDTDGSGNTWLLADNTGGFWEDDLGFGFIPTMLRIYNTNQDGRGTKTFYFEELNSGGVLNLTYVDPSTGQENFCVSRCPLPQGNTTAQDFRFDRVVGMSSFRIYVTEWYGPGGGLSGIELFQDDIFSYAVNSFNEPACDGVSTGASSTATPATIWTEVQNRGLTNANFLSAYLTDASQVGPGTNVAFMPNLAQSGNYSVTVYTPGCIQDGSCGTRGQVNMTGFMGSGSSANSVTLYQTNNYDKFDEVYNGYIDVDGGFRPSVMLAPMSGQSVPLTVVASRIRFELMSSTGGLNGLYEYNPNEVVSIDFSTSAINSAGSSLDSSAVVNAVAENHDTLYVAGRFTGQGIANCMSVGADNATAFPQGGLNGEVSSMLLNDSVLYFGGDFSDTSESHTEGLNNAAMFSINDTTWRALGAGLNGAVSSIVPLQLNISTNDEQTCFAFTGNFTSINAFNGITAVDVAGFAIWVPSEGKWLENIPTSHVALRGQLTAYAEVPEMEPVYGGLIRSQGMDYSDVVELVGSGEPSISSLGVGLQKSSSTSNSSSSMRKRALTADQSSGSNYTGVYDGFFYSQNNLNITILGGSFSATASNGSAINNLIFINNTDSEQTITGVSGLDSDSIFVAMDTYETMLIAGGAVNGTINGKDATGLVVYDLSANRFATPHPPALGGDDVVVNAIASQPDQSNVYVGGRFATAGSLSCQTLCSYDMQALQWQNTGSGLSGTISAMLWSSNTDLIIAGNLTINGVQTTMATYDTKKQVFTAFTGASTLPGPITAISAVNSDYSEFWVSGVAADQSTFLSKYASGTWTAANGLGATTSIRKLQIMPLTSNHDDSELVDGDQTLMILGNINIPDQGNASAVLFNGTTYEPYVLTNMEDGSQGSLSAIFVSNPQFFMTTNDHHLPLGAIVGIALAIALVLTGLLIAIGFLLERRRRRQEGYIPITQDKSANMSRLPPEDLFAKLEGKPSPPKI